MRAERVLLTQWGHIPKELGHITGNFQKDLQTRQLFRGDSYARRSQDPSVYHVRVTVLQLWTAKTENTDNLERLKDKQNWTLSETFEKCTHKNDNIFKVRLLKQPFIFRLRLVEGKQLKIKMMNTKSPRLQQQDQESYKGKNKEM